MTDLSNSDRLSALCEQFGGIEYISNRELYDLLVLCKEDLINEAKMGLERIPSSPLGREVRARCIYDLKWLAQYMLWDAMPASDGGLKPVENNIFLDPQYDVFAELFVKKDPSVPIHKLSSVKTRVLLWPRGGAKSTYDGIDTVQWILAYPSIRILFLTAESSLSIGFITELKNFFTLREDTPTFMNLFWPEMCCLEKEMRKGNLFICPEWKRKKIKRKEATVIASSVGKTKSGWHYEVIKADDAVSDRNSETETQCISVSEKLDLVENLLIPGGEGYYTEYIGTRYHELDHYGKLVDKFRQKGEIVVAKEGRGWQFLHNKTFNVDILIGKCCQIKPEVADQLSREGRPVTYAEAGADGCILLLPNLMPYSFFMLKYAKNERVTEGQLNQNPQASSDVEFSRMLMLRATIPFQMMPRQGPISQFWDFAFSKKKGRDYSTGCSVMWGEEPDFGPDGKQVISRDGRPLVKTVGYARKIRRGKHNHLSLAQAVVQLVREDRPFVLGIEDAAGSKFLEPTIISEAIKTGDPYVIDVCSRIDWITPDNQVDAKKVRMRALYPWIAEGRLKFLNACMQPDEPNLEVLYSEFEKCLVSHRHDDVPDVLSQQPRYAPRATQAIVENNVDMISRVDQMGWNELYNPESNAAAYYDDGTGKLIPWESPNPFPDQFTAAEPDLPAETPYGMDNILGTGVFG